ncbi:hypothetical protein RO3G_13459 [Rhizopus delemar RA 99-880]|uniref:Uncharacterized protein n=3 Tax=Rhizopus TaxID=4842 RepID=I1CJW8_RHIO9|nr:hypothetical protein RO3G_13459 [Rhizopus delemar RA 99-880]|eukprot:EIE88748.1 hypothetical protein RO3G_13459 [Rhizopus delemar RA 99-880]
MTLCLRDVRHSSRLHIIILLILFLYRVMNNRYISHFLECDLIPSFLWSDLPRCPPGSYPIDYALSALPLGRSACCPPWWSSLLPMLWHIQRLCRPDRYYPIDSSPGASWYSRSSARSD